MAEKFLDSIPSIYGIKQSEGDNFSKEDLSGVVIQEKKDSWWGAPKSIEIGYSSLMTAVNRLNVIQDRIEGYECHNNRLIVKINEKFSELINK